MLKFSRYVSSDGVALFSGVPIKYLTSFVEYYGRGMRIRFAGPRLGKGKDCLKLNAVSFSAYVKV